ncbi:hypothetical protein PMI07_002071 [Rhizobium sp. CF080]|uniref:hypothetical protein n=1 Tax=Rhizobium sp. (strain CF080) TaxID=1144310 RepID=UPI000271A3BC|nr:hypothetical protein [Rhizobium sp. CF080]EUB95583.1 hypothetical protein PMI07_002071 [Rhizobium sp. CF080]
MPPMTAKQLFADGPVSHPYEPEKPELRKYFTAMEASTKLFDGLDIRQYATEKDLFGQYAVEKIQEAIDADETDLLTFPAGIIPIADSVIIWRTMTFRGIGDGNFWREVGDSTGGVVHPKAGTIFWTEGAGVSRVWTSRTDADDPINPMFVRLGSAILFEDFAIRTGPRSSTPGDPGYAAGLSGSAAGWHSAVFDAGTRGHRNRRVSAQGLGNIGFQHARYIDGTNSKYNTALLALPHYSKIDANLFDVGPTDIKDRECLWSAVKSVTVKGREGTFPGGQNPYGPNGVSDLDIDAYYYNDGPLADRMDHGALVDVDYKMSSNWADGSNGGQNLTFSGRFDAAGKYSLKLGHCRKVIVWADYCETGSKYQQDVTDYNTANGTTLNTRAIVQTDSTCTGSFGIYSKGWFSNIRVDTGSDVPPYNFVAIPKLGQMMEYDGLGNGERNGLLLRSGGFDNNVIPEFGSPATNGEMRDVYKDNVGKDTFIRRRRRSAGKGEVSYDGVSWFTYEKDVWTPGIAGKTTPGTYALTSGGRWIRKGSEVTARGWILLSAITVAATGQIVITGLPFMSLNNSGAVAAASFANLNGLALTANTVLAGYVAPNTQIIELSMRGNTADANVQSANLSATSRIYFEVTYEIA